jgi:alkylation response protein AidB-like acyl-CoA dehydrogenase
MRRVLFDEVHEEFRATVRRFLAREVTPHYAQWEANGIAPRSFYLAAGRAGLLGLAVPEEHGGGGTSDFRFNAVVGEEIAAAGIGGAGLGLTSHNDVVTPYFTSLATDEQKHRWLPGIASGDLIGAIAMTEPGTGSDLRGIRTIAKPDGDAFELTGSKTFITNGINSDLVIVVARTAEDGNFTLLVVERGMDGFVRGRNLDKLGLHSADTSELYFDRVRVPAANVLGTIGRGLQHLGANLAQERLSIAAGAVAYARFSVAQTVDYVRSRHVFGQPLSSLQNTQFVLAEVQGQIEVVQAHVDACILALKVGELTAADAAVAKWKATDLQKEAADRCLQLFGGYGYMNEYPIARAYADARVAPIYGGTNEIMKVIVARDMGL